MSLHCFAEKNQALAALAENICSISRAALQKRAFFSLVLAGGSTPEDLYRLLASKDWRQRIEWSRTHIFFGDERCVPPEHGDSNYRMAHDAMLAKLPIPERQIYRIHGEADPAAEADRYEYLIRTTLLRISTDEPLFDIVLLGLGHDGHTASLFPGDSVLRSGRLVVSVAAPRNMTPEVGRISLGLQGIMLSRHICFLVHGEEKEDVVRAVLADDTGRFPAAMVQGKTPLWYLSGMKWRPSTE